MARYKNRARVKSELVGVEAFRLRKAMAEIRLTLGLEKKASLEDTIAAVKALVEKDGQDPSAP